MALRIPGIPIPNIDPVQVQTARRNENGGCSCPSRCYTRLCPCLANGSRCGKNVCKCKFLLCGRAEEEMELEEVDQVGMDVDIPAADAGPSGGEIMPVQSIPDRPVFAPLPPTWNRAAISPDVAEIMTSLDRMRPDDIATFLNQSDGIVALLLEQLSTWIRARDEQYSESRAAEGGALNGCICGNCVITGHEFEDACCEDPNCVTNDPYFINIITNPYSLQLQMASKNDLWGSVDDATDNVQYRYYSYRSFILWKYGLLGKDYRIPLPSCAYRVIRRLYPSEIYTHFVNKGELLATINDTRS